LARATDVEVKVDRILVAVFADEMTAKQGAQALKDSCADGASTLMGVSVVSKDARGKLTVAEEYHESARAGIVAALIGALAGWAAGGPMAALIFAAGGALIGISADMIHRGGHVEAVKRVSNDLPRGKSAVITRLSQALDPDVNAIMNRLGAKVVVSSP
jgi:uncharacterized membrane protein